MRISSKTPNVVKMTAAAESAIDDDAIAASWAAIDEADKLAVNAEFTCGPNEGHS